MSETIRRSGAWYLLPVLLHAIGGIIAYYVIRCDDEPKAKNCLYLGLCLTAATVGLAIVGYALSWLP